MGGTLGGNMSCGMGGIGCGMGSTGCGGKGGCKDCCMGGMGKGCIGKDTAGVELAATSELVLQQLDQLPPLTDSTRQAMLELPAQEALAILERLRQKQDTVRNVSSYLYKAANNYFQGIGPRQLGGNWQGGGPPVMQANFRSWGGGRPELEPNMDMPNSFEGVAPPGCSPQQLSMQAGGHWLLPASGAV